MAGAAMFFEIDVEIRRGGQTVSGDFKALSGLTALFGSSGAGKTSVLDAVAGLLRPERGRIVVDGRTLFDSAAGVNLPPEQRGCGYVFQDNRLFPHRTVAQNLTFGLRLAPQGARWMTPDEAVDFLDLGHMLERMPRTLSGGEARRVAIGRALLSGPKCVLMDEPLAFLDEARREEIMQVIERVRDELRLPILYVSHDRTEVERLADQVIPVGPPASR